MNDPQKRSAATAIRAAMLRRGWVRRDLARATGLSPKTITNVVTGHIKSSRARALVEQALGLPFWTEPKAFAASRDARKRYGIDPRALTLPKLRDLAATHQPTSRPYFVASSREELLRCLGVAAADTEPRRSTASKSSNHQP